MKYGICTDFENGDLLKRMGFDYIEPRVVSLVQMSASERKENRQRLADIGLSAEAFNCLFPGDIKLIGPEADLQRIREYLKEALAYAAEFGAKVVVFGSGASRRVPDGYSFAKAYGELCEVYRIAGQIAGENGIDIVVEPLSYSETNMINTIEEGAILAQNVNLPHVRLLADYYHMIANHDNLEHILTIGDFGHIHIAAGAGRLYPLSRDGEYYETLIGNLKAIGYEGRISIEGSTKDMEADGTRALALLKEIEGK